MTAPRRSGKRPTGHRAVYASWQSALVHTHARWRGVVMATERQAEVGPDLVRSLDVLAQCSPQLSSIGVPACIGGCRCIHHQGVHAPGPADQSAQVLGGVRRDLELIQIDGVLAPDRGCVTVIGPPWERVETLRHREDGGYVPGPG